LAKDGGLATLETSMSETGPSLSKSRFLAGLQCPKRLYLEVHHRDLATPTPPATQRIFNTGHEVGNRAQQQFPDGILIEAEYYEKQKALDTTTAAVASGKNALFEPAFLYDNVFIRIDVLRPNSDTTWDLIEAKSVLTVSDTHVIDAAVQRYVTEGAGLSVNRCCIMHLNRDCTFPDLSNLFILEDVTAQVAKLLPSIPDQVAEFNQIIARTEPPNIPIGKHCDAPYMCQFKEHCWQHVSEPSIFSIPRISAKKIDQLVSQGITSIHYISDDFKLSENQQRHVDVFKNNKPQILWPAICDQLATLQYPLHFLDFETQMEAIPRLPGLRPFNQYPFQFSLHILHENGNLDNFEYLHRDASDPREPLAKALLDTIDPTGTIIAYNASFEIRVIGNLAWRIPSLRHSLYSLRDRFFDLLPIFRDYYFHPGFLGSNSIKDILPVLVPELSYSNLEVHGGDEAQLAWAELITTDDESRRLQLAASLFAYCRLDTLAMVRLYEALRAESSQTI
jgi:hypothetical protein